MFTLLAIFFAFGTNGSLLEEQDPNIYVLDSVYKEVGSISPLHRNVFEHLRRISVKNPANADFIFVDVDTFMQKFWPVYLKTSNSKHHPMILDSDTEIQHLWKEKVYIDTLKTFLRERPKQNITAKFVYFYDIDYKRKKDVLRRHRVREMLKDYNCVYLGNDIVKQDVESAPGVNILPPINKYLRSTIDLVERDDREILVTFRGRSSTDHLKRVRSAIFNLKPEDTKVDLLDTLYNNGPAGELIKAYKNSDFSFCPGGTKPYSFRPGEALTYGSIPVIMIDDAVPIQSNNWTDWAVIIPEDQVDNAIDILKKIPESKKEEMFQAGREMARCVNSIPGYIKCMLKALKINFM
mmetsp:Transcript_19797/g.27500  ORF Transcript_19797/g.27500 Transcript_19797/m.27500 type:complete len:351 (-) Transcript_19797:96-1148(-)